MVDSEPTTSIHCSVRYVRRTRFQGLETSDQSADPIDGKWAGVVVIAAFICLTLISIPPSAVAILTVEWEQRMGFTPSQVSWATILVNALAYSAAPVVGALNTQFGCRPVVFTGGILAMMSTLLLSFIKELWQINVCSAGIGLAMGLAYQGSVIIVNMYCEKWLGRANGFAQGGVGVGLMVGSPLMALLIKSFTWRGAVLILAGLSANISVVAALYRPPSWWPYLRKLWKEARVVSFSDGYGKERMLSSKEGVQFLGSTSNDTQNTSEKQFTAIENNNDFSIHEDTKGHDKAKRNCFENKNKIGEMFRIKDKDSNKHYTIVNSCCVPESNAHTIDRINQQTDIKNPKRANSCIKMFDLFGFSLLWTSAKVSLLCLSSTFRGFGYFPSFIYLSSYIVSTGVDELRASFIFTIIGICSLIGRLIHGFLIDFKVIAPVNLLALSCIVAGGSTFILVFCSSYSSFATYAVVFGMSSGAFNALTPVVTKKYTAPSQLARAFGLQNFFIGMNQLIGTYFLGLLYDRTNKYRSCFCFTGASLLASGVVALVIEPISRRLNGHRFRHRYGQCDEDGDQPC